MTVLNTDDHDWYYIRTADGTEGFVPRSFLWQATCAPGTLKPIDTDMQQPPQHILTHHRSPNHILCEANKHVPAFRKSVKA